MGGAISQVLLAVAAELAAKAKDSLPKLQNDETVRREWLKDGVYCREPVRDGKVFLAQYDFKTKGCCVEAA